MPTTQAGKHHKDKGAQDPHISTHQHPNGIFVVLALGFVPGCWVALNQACPSQ